jgi:deoxyribonuclease V
LTKRGLFSFGNIESAIAKQKQLSQLVVAESSPSFRPRLLCGLDVAYDDRWAVAVASVWDAKTRKVLEARSRTGTVEVSYIPGLLGFREGPLVIRAARRLKLKPDLFLVDGHGLAHPRGFGLACHVGLALNKPTVGVAKSRLCGEAESGKILAPTGELVGGVLQTEFGRTYFVSVGHRIGLEDAVRIVRDCIVDGYPVPLRVAHLESVRLRRNRWG